MSDKPGLHAALPALVVVSGTASGLGTRIARQLVDCGVTTIGVDIASQPGSLKNRLYVHMQGDVSQDKVWTAVGDEIRKVNPASVGLVTSAAMLEVGTILEFDRAALEKAMAVNFVGTALAIRAALPHMIERGGGSIVAVASVNGTVAEQQLSVYNASKGAVRQLARTVAMDHARQGIRANVLSPGAMLAGLFERHMKSAGDPEKFDAGRAPAHRKDHRSGRRRESGFVPTVGRFRGVEWLRTYCRRRPDDELRFSHRQRRGLDLSYCRRPRGVGARRRSAF